MAAARKTARSSGEGTRARILEGALLTLRTQGIAGASARAIAEAADVNPALLFYHFGSLDEVLLAAARADTAERVERYRPQLEPITTFEELVGVARGLHADNLEHGNVTALVQLLAATGAKPDLRAPMSAIFDPWIALVRETIDRVTGGEGLLGGIIGSEDAAVGVTSLFLGLELLTHLGDEHDRADRLLDSLDEVAGLVTAFGALGAALAPGSGGGQPADA